MRSGRTAAGGEVGTSPSWRLVVDPTSCDAHGICALKCPDLLALDEWGYPVLLHGAAAISKGPARRAARRAVRACPEGALRLEPTGTAGVVPLRRRVPATRIRPEEPADQLRDA